MRLHRRWAGVLGAHNIRPETSVKWCFSSQEKKWGVLGLEAALARSDDAETPKNGR